jgi:hypothetical protein
MPNVPGNLGSVNVTGSLNSDGSFSLNSTQQVNLSLNGLTLAAAAGSVTVSGSSSGLSITVSGSLTLPGNFGSVSVSGNVNSDGTFSVTGNGNVNLGNILSGSVVFTIASSGVTFSGTFGIPGIGSLPNSFTASINGDGSLDILGVHLANPASIPLDQAADVLVGLGASFTQVVEALWNQAGQDFGTMAQVLAGVKAQLPDIAYALASGISSYQLYDLVRGLSAVDTNITNIAQALWNSNIGKFFNSGNGFGFGDVVYALANGRPSYTRVATP